MRPIRAVIVDDHPIVAEGLRRVFELAGGVKVVGYARSLAEAKIILREATPDVILSDLRLRDSQGGATIVAIKATCPESKLVVLTATGWGGEAEARRLGADAFLQKESASDVIAEIIHKLFPARARGSVSEPALTLREREVARLAAEGMTNPEIAKALYISQNTVKTHLVHIFEKLGLTNRVHLARYWTNPSVDR